MLRAAIHNGVINSRTKVADGQIQPASIDLRLGAKAYRLRSSFLPGAGARVRTRLSELQQGPALDLSATEGVVLEPRQPYLIPLLEKVALPDGVRARANPRSSTGRLDIFTRVITDRGSQFDEVDEGYEGPLWLELYSSTFTVNVRKGLALTQLRLSSGECPLSVDETTLLHEQESLAFERVEQRQYRRIPRPTIGARGLLLTVNLPSTEFVGWKAKRNTPLLDLAAVDEYEALQYWEPVFAERGGRLVLHPNDFHLLISREYVRIPPTVAAEMVAYDPSNGELRTHYAGFFDPGFGYGTDVEGTRAVLEVRAHDIPFLLEDGQPIARLAYERMAEPPDRLYGSSDLGSHFQRQEINLSRQFKAPKGEFSFRLVGSE